MNNVGASPVFLSLTDVLRALRAAVAGWGGRGLLGGVLVLLLYRRLGKISGKMERLAARFQAGRLWRLAPRVSVRAPEACAAVRRDRGPAVWPVPFGWLVRVAGYQAAGFGTQLRAILEQPEMVALLVAAPQAVRVLRPLCRMLAIETRLLRPEAPAVEVVPVVMKRVRGAHVPVGWTQGTRLGGAAAVVPRSGLAKRL